jgi:hypothetical protein
MLAARAAARPSFLIVLVLPHTPPALMNQRISGGFVPASTIWCSSLNSVRANQ